MSEHRWFAAVFAFGALLRLVAMLGYRPALWFPDTYTYVVTALVPRPDLVRPAGYSMFLRLFEPLHSFAFVAFVQHLLGLATAAMVYAAALRLRAPRWAATAAAAPVLLDAYQVELEHLLVSDTLFMFLVTAAVCLGLKRAPGWRTGIVAGLLVAAATLTRSVGLPLFVVLGLWLLVRRAPGAAAMDPRREVRARAVRAGVMLAAAAIPVIAYGGWFYATYQRIGIVGANGVFLYARTMSFADCSVMRPPPDTAVLCDPRPPELRPPSQEYIWAADSPLVVLPGITFSEDNDDRAGRFATLAIRSQPGDYLASMMSELARTFSWGRPVYPDQEIYDYYEFPEKTPGPPGRYPAQVGRERAMQYEQGPIETRVVEPFAWTLRAYQDVARLPGAVLLVVLLAPPVVAGVRVAGVRVARARPWRAGPGGYREPGRALRAAGEWAWVLPWATAWMLLIMPPAVAEFDYRYVLPAVPPAFLAAALAVRGRVQASGNAPAPGDELGSR
ncbi:hypothetical protein HNP84_004513 [Thermocatellispora tengchongensis]|uniref:ArnT-like N-terminal domain-containing protein n=3 Tax=Thermocatellispora tengchongensis TaxID=1073253 RepID=A0A840P6Z9_9ACTN|nr:phospholipid carrier-dependent glycosyltransferase [Thermocatellispora tengchongensis]MBB5134779.1 hypothetical protein [Thermocatellispora tengchongensis]